jgi:hypothetical protein
MLILRARYEIRTVDNNNNNNNNNNNSVQIFYLVLANSE